MLWEHKLVAKRCARFSAGAGGLETGTGSDKRCEVPRRTFDFAAPSFVCFVCFVVKLFHETTRGLPALRFY